jgi:hypothetical protein
VLGSKHGVITPVETIATAVPGLKPLEYSSSDPHDPPH